MYFTRFTATYWFILLGIVIAVSCSARADNTLHNITYYTEHYPPSSYYHNNQLVGLSVDLMKLLWREQNIPEQPILVVPWARGYQEVSKHPNTALFAMSRTPERENKFKWVGPLFTAEYLVIAHLGNTLPVSNITALFNQSIAVIRDDVTESLVRSAKFPSQQVIRAKDMRSALSLFKANRVDLLAISRSGLNAAIKQRVIGPNSYQSVFLLKSVDDYIAFNKDTPDKVIDAFQVSLDKLSDAHQALKREYKLD